MVQARDGKGIGRARCEYRATGHLDGNSVHGVVIGVRLVHIGGLMSTEIRWWSKILSCRESVRRTMKIQTVDDDKLATDSAQQREGAAR